MSDTPETDAAQVAHLGKPWEVAYSVLRKKSQELERQRNEARSELEQLRTHLERIERAGRV